MEDKLLLKDGNLMRVKVLEQKSGTLKVEVVKNLDGGMQKGTVLEVDVPDGFNGAFLVRKRDGILLT